MLCNRFPLVLAEKGGCLADCMLMPCRPCGQNGPDYTTRMHMPSIQRAKSATPSQPHAYNTPNMPTLACSALVLLRLSWAYGVAATAKWVFGLCFLLLFCYCCCCCCCFVSLFWFLLFFRVGISHPWHAKPGKLVAEPNIEAAWERVWSDVRDREGIWRGKGGWEGKITDSANLLAYSNEDIIQCSMNYYNQ